ncbi:MAG TPA: hypothetical protein ENI24_03690 [Methylophaga sp.]|nr:hypothetical protein [Methylophaga sp.]
MSFINQPDQNQTFDVNFDQQIDQIENEIRRLQAILPVDDDESVSVAGLLDDLFVQLHTIITLKCVTIVEPENTSIINAVQNQQALNILDVAKLAQLMSVQIEVLHQDLAQLDGDTRVTAILKQTIAEFFIARQVLVDTVINDSSEADNFCECSTCQQATYHQFTAAFDYICTQCETAFFK